MMTRKDFEALADAFSGVVDGFSTAHTGADVLLWVAESVAKVCAESNPRFDMRRFLERADVGAVLDSGDCSHGSTHTNMCIMLDDRA